MNQDAILPTHLCSSWLCPIKLAGALTITALLMASGCSDSPPSTPIDQSDQAELTELTETTDLDPELDGVELPDQDPELDSLDDDADAELPPTCVPGCNEAQLTQCDEEGNPIVSDCTVACVAEGEDFYCSCAGDQDCPEGSYCDPRGLCVDEPCVPGSAVCQDSVALQCLPDGSGYARVTCEAGCRDGVCLCTQDEDCAEQEFCDPEGNCLARLCVPDALFCDGAALVLCDERGAAFSQLEDCGEAGCLDGACGCTSSADCPPSQFCAPGVGPEGQNLCQDDLCPAGTRLCVDGSLSACSDDGGTLSTIATCAQGCVTEGEQAWCACTQTEDCETEQFCDPNGHCIGAVCDPALATCDGNVAVRCTPDGSSEIRQNCGSGVCDAGHCLCTSDAGCAANQHCDTSAGQCVDDLCLQGSSFCDGRDRRQCSSNGSSSALLETCSLGCVDNGTLSACRCNNTSHCPIEQYCHPNAFEGFDVCRPDICNAGDYGCDGNTSVTCAADGGSELRVSCGLASCVNGDCVCSSDAQCIAAQYCSPFGRCEADLCNASTLYCLGDDVLLCDSRGVESTLVQGCEPGQCAAGTCVCTGSGDCAEHESCDTGVCVCDSGLRCGPSQSCCLSGDICEDDACKIPCSGVRCGVDERLCCPEACETLPSGVAFCVEPCSSDVDCPSAQHCNGSYCIDDICTPGQSRCAGNSIERCNARGSAWLPTMNCGSDAYFLSSCVDLGGGQAACTCEDDWDCPAYTVCEQGACQGTGVAPTCRLPAEPFSNVLPTPEIVWGGVQGNRNAVAKVMQGGTLTQIETSPFPNSNQVVHTPLVANLDDDNGDGLINEADFPEIIFLTFCNSEYTTNGVLRAIHGGGPNKGRNYFANCGSSVWHEGDSMSMSCTCSNATIDSTSTIAVGDLDYDGIPEIVAVGESNQVFIYDNTGELIASNAGVNFVGANPAAAIANVDNIGNAEIIIGRHIFTVERNSSGALVFVDRFDGTNTSIVGRNGQGPASCVANLVGDERLELITGSIVYRFPEAPPGVSKRSECAGPYSNPDHTAYCAGKLVVAWDGVAVNGSVSVRDGFCAIADVLGADRSAAPGPSNPLDGKPEVILIAGGRLEIFGGDDGVIHRNISLTGSGGGAPNVDDFDGDGFPEIGTAGSTFYILHDLQATSPACPAWPNTMSDAQASPGTNPVRTANGTACSSDADCVSGEAVCNTEIGQCVCLHNGWRRGTEDDSSQVTGSSVFDFNGDGAAEVVYNDECYFRIYDGIDGTVWFKEPSESRTRIEYPIVADSDNDGNAEIIFATTNESGFCSANQDPLYNNGIEVWGDAGDYWVSARRIWNQYAYHVTNVTESGAIPLIEPDNWGNYAGRSYNTYRSNPRSFGVAPDLVTADIQLTSPDASCGVLTSLLDISIRVENAGDVRVGPGVELSFDGEWTGLGLTEPLLDGAGQPLSIVLANNIEPRSAVYVRVSFDAANNTPGTLPDILHVAVDATDLERECHELNNLLTVPVAAGALEADLRVEVGAVSGVCPSPVLAYTIFNDGSAPASNFVLRFYAGSPYAGGSILQDVNIVGPVPAGGQLTGNVTFSAFPSRLVSVYAFVDPDDQVPECNDGNNVSPSGSDVPCGNE